MVAVRVAATLVVLGGSSFRDQEGLYMLTFPFSSFGCAPLAWDEHEQQLQEQEEQQEQQQPQSQCRSQRTNRLQQQQQQQQQQEQHREQQRRSQRVNGLQ